jgi:exodeoxyribonuclease VII large subunit
MPTPDSNIYSVSALNREVKGLLEAEMPVLWVQGEISRVSTPASGHLYFTLKDSDARVDCVMWRSTASRVKVRPRDGLQVLIRGRVALYERDGRFQLYADHMEDAGEGLLRQRLEELQKRLSAEGLFDQARKQPLPRYPRRIGVITSASGAAVGDVLRVLARRCPSIPVIIYPTPVQGETAAASIAAAIAKADERAECDALILCRGGGSLEDLWCFNDERVVRAIVGCSIPLVSGVGHEMDITLTDLAADVRAPTPSGAAELASPDRNELAATITQIDRHLLTLITSTYARFSQRVDFNGRRLSDLHPGSRIKSDQERLRLLANRMGRTTRETVRSSRLHLNGLTGLLRSASPARDIGAMRRRIGTNAMALVRGSRRSMSQRRDRLAATVHALESVSPLATLARGYSIIEGEKGLVRSVNSVEVGDAVRAKLRDGHLGMTVTGVEPED